MPLLLQIRMSFNRKTEENKTTSSNEEGDAKMKQKNVQKKKNETDLFFASHELWYAMNIR